MQKCKTEWIVLVLDPLEGDLTKSDLGVPQATAVSEEYYERWRKLRLSAIAKGAANTTTASTALTYARNFDTYKNYESGLSFENPRWLFTKRARHFSETRSDPPSIIESAATSLLCALDLPLGQDAKLIPDFAYRPNWSDTEKRARCFSQKYRCPRSMKYAIEEHNDSSISLFIPYVPYKHFQMSEGHRYGFKYSEYLDLLAHLWHPYPVHSDFSGLKQRLCKIDEAERIELQVWPGHATDDVGTPFVAKILAALEKG